MQEGYGENAWHGANLKTALADVTPELAFWRPGPDRHNIAEIARAGADTFVAGSAIFGTKDYKATIAAMRAELNKA